MEIIITLAFAVLAICIVFCVLRTKKELNSIDKMWKYRKKIAHIANKIEQDPNAPEHAKLFICCLANNAFSEEYMKDVLLHATQQRKFNKPKGARKYMEEEFGKEYGDLIYEAVKNFALIIIKSDIKLPRESNIVLENTRKFIKSLSGIIHDQTNDYIETKHHTT